MPEITNRKHIILVVEDEMPLQNAIRMKMEKNDFSVVTARNVDQAKNHLQDLPRIDVIWLDHYLLGTETGLDFVAWLKEQPTFKAIPIFVVSNTASADKVKTYLSLGVEKYYTKSNFRLEQIIEEIHKTLTH